MRYFPIGIIEGGPGSGHHGHKGLKGVWGGSSSDGSGGKHASHVSMDKEKSPTEKFKEKYFSGKGMEDPDEHWSDVSQDRLKILFGDKWKYFTPDFLEKFGELSVIDKDGKEVRLKVSGFRHSLGEHWGTIYLNYGGNLLDEHGEIVGSFSRSFHSKNSLGKPGLSVIQRTLELNERFQGRSLAQEYARNIFPLYDALGVECVEVSTTNVGSYAWARFGFDFLHGKSGAEGYVRDVERRVLDNFIGKDASERQELIYVAFGARSHLPGSSEKARVRMRMAKFDSQEFIKFTDDDIYNIGSELSKFRYPWEFASYKYKGVLLGPALMITGPGWNGILKLKNKESMAFAREYLRMK